MNFASSQPTKLLPRSPELFKRLTAFPEQTHKHILYIYSIQCVETHYMNASFMCPVIIAQASGKTHYKSQLIKNNKTFMFGGS